MRVQLLFAARGGCTDALFARLDDEGQRAKADADSARVIGLDATRRRQFPLANPLCRPFEAVLELQTPPPTMATRSWRALQGTVDRLDDVVHRDLSGVLVGIPHEIILTAPAAVRYLYLMRRKSTHTRDQYFDYYFNNHSRFGHRTPGIVGYTQFHVDDARSRAAASTLGVGTWGADSVSELAPQFDRRVLRRVGGACRRSATRRAQTKRRSSTAPTPSRSRPKPVSSL